MLNLMPLAHGALGSLDEIAAVVVGLAAAIFVVLGFISRKREEENQADPTQLPQVTGQPDTTAPDHYRLD